jgi:hypothetical protein
MTVLPAARLHLDGVLKLEQSSFLLIQFVNDCRMACSSLTAVQASSFHSDRHLRKVGLGHALHIAAERAAQYRLIECSSESGQPDVHRR